jgi:hypothetical protein
VFERTVTEHGLIAPWLLLAGALLVAWHWARKIASKRAVSDRWLGVLVVTGFLVHLNFAAAFGALALAPRRPPWFDPRPISGPR